MAEFKLKKGFDIRLTGAAERSVETAPAVKRYAIKPTDFRGIKPKLDVEVGQDVKAGASLFHEKEHPEIKFTAPVSGKVVEINRGERRLIQSVVVESDGNFESLDFGKVDATNRDALVEVLLKSGLWPTLVQRPFGVLANPEKIPRDIFISGFDSAPLAADVYLQVAERSADFKAGVAALKTLTSGHVHLSLDGNRQDTPEAFKGLDGVQMHSFKGQHPAGVVGVQIHQIKPINRGEIVWTIKPSDVLAIGALVQTGKMNSQTVVAVAGENAKAKKYYATHRGALVSELVGDVVDNSRYISGNVLTGSKVEANGFVGFSDTTVSVIPEGNRFEFLGWVLPGLSKSSFSGTYLSKFFPKKSASMNTNLNGGHRAFVQTGYYEQVLPMDIYPMHLLKACLSEDIELMEGLGIYEVIEEDIALCEYICPSKSEMQDMLKDGIALMISES